MSSLVYMEFSLCWTLTNVVIFLPGVLLVLQFDKCRHWFTWSSLCAGPWQMSSLVYLEFSLCWTLTNVVVGLPGVLIVLDLDKCRHWFTWRSPCAGPWPSERRSRDSRVLNTPRPASWAALSSAIGPLLASSLNTINIIKITKILMCNKASWPLPYKIWYFCVYFKSIVH